MVRLIFGLPVIQLAVLPWAATFEQKDIRLCVVDNDRSTHSVRLREKALSSGFFKLSTSSPAFAGALGSVESGDADLILEIPAGFEKDCVNGIPSQLMLSIDALNGQKASLGMLYMTRIIQDFNASGQSPPGATQPGVALKPYYKYNLRMNYRNLMVPGVIVILVSILGAMLSAMNIVREKETGTMEQINVTPVSRTVFILAKLIPFWVIGLLNLSIGMLFAFLIYGLFPAGNIANIYIFAFAYLLAFTGFGLIISNYAQSQQQAMFVVLFFLIIFILLGGLFTPISSMPGWVQAVTVFNPVRYFIEVMRLVYLKGSGFTDILPQLFRICVFLVVFNTLAVVSYRKKSR
jgi:ABC-2 type transport system permease protein